MKYTDSRCETEFWQKQFVRGCKILYLEYSGPVMSYCIITNICFFSRLIVPLICSRTPENNRKRRLSSQLGQSVNGREKSLRNPHNSEVKSEGTKFDKSKPNEIQHALAGVGVFNACMCTGCEKTSLGAI